jgi:hypothetical protein
VISLPGESSSCVANGGQEDRTIAGNIQAAYSISLVTKKQVYVDALQGIRCHKDLVGHAFIILQSPTFTRVVGFYPEQFPGFEVDWWAFWCIRRRGMPGNLLDDEYFLTDPHYECRITTYQITEQQYVRAERFIAKFERACHTGRIRHRAFSQCAHFALQTLRAAGVGPRLRLPYPPFLHWWLHD